VMHHVHTPDPARSTHSTRTDHADKTPMLRGSHSARS